MEILRNSQKKQYKIPFYSASIPAGFPSPAADYIERTLDLNELCIVHPAATYLVRAQGDSMIQGGIHSGDILIVDRSLEAKHHNIIIASLNGEFTVKRLCLKPTLQLESMNPDYGNIIIGSESELELFGVVTFIIHPCLP